MTFTKEQIGRMTSDEYKANIGNERFAPLTPEQIAFRALVDGPSVSSAETPRPAPRNTSNSLRGRAEAGNVPVEEKTFDPSFDDSPNVPAAPAAEAIVIADNGPVVPAVAAESVVPPVVPSVTVESPEQIHEYIIADENGKAIGGKQVFKYRTKDELIAALTKSNINVRVMVQKLREEQIMNSTEVPANATVSGQLELRPLLTDEERAAWEEKRYDPADAAKVQYILDRDDDRRAHNDLVHSNYENRVLLALESFKNNNRSYVQSQYNAAKLISYMDRRGLDPTDSKNYQTAFDVLRESGIIANTNQPAVPELVTAAPTMREEKTVPNPQAPVEQTARISPVVPPQEKRTVAPIPTGLSNTDQVSDAENPMLNPNWLTVRSYLKDGQGKPTSQYQEFHNLEAVLRLEGRAEKEFYNSMTPAAKALRAKYEAELAAKEARLAEAKRKYGYN